MLGSVVISELVDVRGLQVAWVLQGLLGCLVREIGVDVAYVLLAPRNWYVGRCHLLLKQVLPANSCEEGVSHDLFYFQPLLRVSAEQSFQERASVRGEAWKNFYILVDDSLQDNRSRLRSRMLL